MAIQSFFNKYIGDRKFYKYVLALSVPIMIQNGIPKDDERAWCS